MAEGLVNHDLGDQVQAFSAGTAPKGLDPRAVAVMAELDIDIGHQQSKHVSRYADQPFDAVITLCDDASEACPLPAAGARRLHLGFPDPARAAGGEREVLAAFRGVRDALRQELGAFLRCEFGI